MTRANRLVANEVHNLMRGWRSYRTLQVIGIACLILGVITLGLALLCIPIEVIYPDKLFAPALVTIGLGLIAWVVALVADASDYDFDDDDNEVSTESEDPDPWP